MDSMGNFSRWMKLINTFLGNQPELYLKTRQFLNNYNTCNRTKLIQCHCAQLYEYYDMNVFNVISQQFEKNDRE